MRHKGKRTHRRRHEYGPYKSSRLHNGNMRWMDVSTCSIRDKEYECTCIQRTKSILAPPPQPPPPPSPPPPSPLVSFIQNTYREFGFRDPPRAVGILWMNPVSLRAISVSKLKHRLRFAFRKKIPITLRFMSHILQRLTFSVTRKKTYHITEKLTCRHLMEMGFQQQQTDKVLKAWHEWHTTTV